MPSISLNRRPTWTDPANHYTVATSRSRNVIPSLESRAHHFPRDGPSFPRSRSWQHRSNPSDGGRTPQRRISDGDEPLSPPELPRLGGGSVETFPEQTHPESSSSGRLRGGRTLASISPSRLPALSLLGAQNVRWNILQNDARW